MKLKVVARLVVDARLVSWPDEWQGVQLGLKPAFEDIAKDVEALTSRIKTLSGKAAINSSRITTWRKGWSLQLNLDSFRGRNRSERLARVSEFCRWVDESKAIMFKESLVGGVSIAGERVSDAVKRALEDCQAEPGSRHAHGARPARRAHAGNENAGMFLSQASLGWPCSVAELKAAFRRIALQTHPDHNPEDPEAANKFRLLKDGYESLLKEASARESAPTHGRR